MAYCEQQRGDAHREYSAASIRRTLDGSIDFRFYRRRAHCLRSGVAWDILSHMSQVLPFFRRDPASMRSDRSDCTMI